MIKRWLALSLGLLLTSLCLADLKIKGETKAAPYKLLVLKVESSAKDAAFLWQPFPDGLDAHVHEDGTEVILTGVPGTYRLGVIGGYNDDKGRLKLEQAYVTVTIGGEPGPGPGPTPTPVDSEVVKAFKAAYAQETDEKKRVYTVNLAAVYRNAATEEYLSKFSKGKDLDSAIGQAVRTLNGPMKIVTLQGAVSEEIKKTIKLGTEDAIETPVRSKLIEAYRRVSAALDATAATGR